MTDQALEGIIFRAAHPVVDRLAPYPAAQRAALLPNVRERDNAVRGELSE